VIHIEDFYEKDVSKLSHFKEDFFINHHISTIGSNWSQKFSRILKRKSTILSNLQPKLANSSCGLSANVVTSQN
jgi:hypothetical protein